MRPMIPLLLANLATFACETHTNLQLRKDRENVFKFVNLHPAAGPANAIRLFNQNFDMTAATAVAAGDPINVIRMGGLSVPFQFNNDNSDYAYDYLRRTNFLGSRGINVAIKNGMSTQAGLAMDQTRNCSSIDSFLFLDKDKNGHWADYLFDQLAIAAKHFDGNANLSQLPVTGGMESTIICNLRTPTAQANNYVYADERLGSTTTDHYDLGQAGFFKELSASFWTPRADIEREEELQAFAIGINATAPIHGSNLLTSGHFFANAGTGATAAEATVISRTGHPELTVRGQVEMYQGWESLFVRKCFRNKPVNV